MPQVFKRPQAEIDLLDIWSYISQDSFEAADRFLEKPLDNFNFLAENPMAGRAREELLPGLRSFPAGRYLIFYTPMDDGITLDRVLHGARNVEAVFREP
jgi:toxin ParE1/3/4